MVSEGGQKNSNKLTKEELSKLPKQNRYYYNHRGKINRTRRKQYRINQELSKQIKKVDENLKPNDIKDGSLGSKIEELNRLYASLVKDVNRAKPEKNLILGFNDLLEFSSKYLTDEQNISNTIGSKPTSFFARPELVHYIAFYKQRSYSQIEQDFKDKLSSKQLKRTLQSLVNLKWLIRENRADLTAYRPNPFLEVLKDIDESCLYLCFYASLQIDFFDLLNVPLLNAVQSGQKINNAKIEFQKFEMGSHAQWIRAFFEGLVSITLTSENGNIFETYLPVNKHASSKIGGYDPKSKKPITDPYGFYHHTIPLKWSMFDIAESTEFTKKGRKSRWDKNPTEYIYIHFDNSFKIIYYNQKDAYGYHQYLTFRQPFEKLLDTIWSKKNRSCQYVEVSDFEILQRLFTLRFVDGKRRSVLFDALGIHYAKSKKAPYVD